MSRKPTVTASFSSKIRRSIFTGILIPVSRSDDVRQNLASIKKEHHTANHICWAYRVIENGQLMENTSDAGEPAGTAGLPILNALKKTDSVNAALFVARIFGGQKLGKPGLTEAYGSVAEKTLAQGSFRSWVPKEVWHLQAPIEYFGKLMHYLEDCDGRIIKDSSAGEISWKISIPSAKVEHFANGLMEKSNGQGVFEKE